MSESLRDLAVDAFHRGQDEVTAQLQIILTRVLERVIPIDVIEFEKSGETWCAEVDEIKFRMRHEPVAGWLTEVWSPQYEWVHFHSLASLGAVLSADEVGR